MKQHRRAKGTNLIHQTNYVYNIITKVIKNVVRSTCTVLALGYPNDKSRRGGPTENGLGILNHYLGHFLIYSLHSTEILRELGS